MKSRVLLDTGLLLAHLYADKDVILDAAKLALRQKGRRAIEDLLTSGAKLLLTYQNLREAYVTATPSKQAREGINLPPRRAVQDPKLIYERDLFIIVPEDDAVLQKWLDILYRNHLKHSLRCFQYLAYYSKPALCSSIIFLIDIDFRRNLQGPPKENRQGQIYFSLAKFSINFSKS